VPAAAAGIPSAAPAICNTLTKFSPAMAPLRSWAYDHAAMAQRWQLKDS
jgi:hypothetical protein